MKTLEYKTLDKSKWGDGPWQNEPDKRQWQDQHTGYPCIIRRGPSGGWCGYVGISNTHPAFEKHYDDVDVEVHGGLTFAGRCMNDRPKETGICHVVEDGEDDNVWWLGFDCAHGSDYMPAFKAEIDALKHDKFIAESFNTLSDLFSGGGEPFETYKDINYVTAEVVQLAVQLKIMERAA